MLKITELGTPGTKGEIALCALDLDDAARFVTLKPIVPGGVSDRAWLLLVAFYGIQGAYERCFREYWRQHMERDRERKPLIVLLGEWLSIAGVKPEFAPINTFA